MNLRAERNIDQRQSVARKNVGFRAAHDRLANFDSVGGDDVAFLTVEISDQDDMRRAVRIVFNLGYATGHTFFVALEIHDAIETFMTAATTTHRNASIVVAS